MVSMHSVKFLIAGMNQWIGRRGWRAPPLSPRPWERNQAAMYDAYSISLCSSDDGLDRQRGLTEPGFHEMNVIMGGNSLVSPRRKTRP